MPCWSREQQARLWAHRTPDGFRFNVKAYSLLTGHTARPQSLWSDIREQLPAETLDKHNVYAHHLPADALEEVWRRFEAPLRPLRQAGRLTTRAAPRQMYYADQGCQWTQTSRRSLANGCAEPTTKISLTWMSLPLITWLT